MDSTIEEQSDGGCEAVSNVTLDQQGFRNENLFSLSRRRRAVKDYVRKKITEVTLFMSQSLLRRNFYSRNRNLTRTENYTYNRLQKLFDHLVIYMK